jgi:uncharacterized protein YkwD
MPPSACVRRRAGARPKSRARRRAAVVAVTAAACALPGAAPADAARQACAAAAGVPGATDGTALRRALRCLVNVERAGQGLRRLWGSRRLGAAARSHAADMVSHGYFDHERPGWTLLGRLRAAGWTGGTAAEAIGWGCGGLGTPRAVLDSWLESPPHRQIILGPYNRAGVGLAVGSPLAIGCTGAGTWVLDVGRR